MSRTLPRQPRPSAPQLNAFCHMIKVQVRPNEPVEAALRRFKRQCNYAGIFRLAKKYSFHEKSSDKNRREDRERERAIKKGSRRPGGRASKRRRTKMRTSSVTPESARRAAEEAAAAKAQGIEATASGEHTPNVAADTGAEASPVQDGTRLRIGSAEAVVGSGETKNDQSGES